MTTPHEAAVEAADVPLEAAFATFKKFCMDHQEGYERTEAGLDALVVDGLRAAIAAYEEALWSDDMDAAPKDGTVVGLCRFDEVGGCVFQGEGYYLDDEWLLLRIKSLQSVEPTHWAPRSPLPAPPQKEG